MNVLLVLAGVLLGVFGTFVGQAIRSTYLDWRNKRNWVIAGRRWTEVLDHITKDRQTVWTERTAEERLEDLQRRVAMIVTSEHIDDFDKQLAYINDHPERLPDHERKEHDERADAIEAATAAGAGVPGLVT